MGALISRPSTIISKPLTHLMNVVMNMLAGNDGCDGVALLGATAGTSALELGGLLLQTGLDGRRIAVMRLTVLYGNDVVVMLFGKNLAILDGLDGSMEMVLVHFAINGSLSLFMAMLGNCFLGHGGGNLLMHGGIMVASLVPDGNELSAVRPLTTESVECNEGPTQTPTSSYGQSCREKWKSQTALQ